MRLQIYFWFGFSHVFSDKNNELDFFFVFLANFLIVSSGKCVVGWEQRKFTDLFLSGLPLTYERYDRTTALFNTHTILDQFD